MKILTMIALVICFNLTVLAQASDETEVKILRGEVSRNWRCRGLTELLQTPASLKKILEEKECTEPGELKVDFSKESLIGFDASGDCHVSAVAHVTRNDKLKTYTVHIKTISGGCRAAGRVAYWLVVEKIPENYKLTSAHTHAEHNEEEIIEEQRKFSHALNAWNAQKMPVADYDMKGCLSLRNKGKLVVTEQTDFDHALQKLPGEDQTCKKSLAKIDFNKNSLLGMHIRSGYCRMPKGLRPYVINQVRERQYYLTAVYIGPEGICRHIGGYDMWILVPKLPPLYGVEMVPLPLDRDYYDTFIKQLDKAPER